MKKFADAKFAVTTFPAGIDGKIQLDNGLEISIIMKQGSYGGELGLWEVGVFSGNKTVDLDCLSGGGVEGYLTFGQLEAKLIEIQEELSKRSIS